MGFEKDFPFQLENTLSGRRLAFVDTEDLKVIDPLLYKGKRVNILGKLEPIEEGKKDLSSASNFAEYRLNSNLKSF